MRKIIWGIVIVVFLLIGGFILKEVFADDSADISLSGKSDSVIALGEKYIPAECTAKTGRGEDCTERIKMSISLKNGDKLKGIRKPEIKKDSILFKYAGDYVVKYFILKEDSDEVIASKTCDVVVTSNKNLETEGLAICMYHYVYDIANPPEKLNSNFISTKDLNEELDYLVRKGYYFPSWPEVRDYVDGKLILPEKSIVLTFDDGAESFLKLGIPIINNHKVPVTSFLITGYDGQNKMKNYCSKYISYESHSDNMHRAGGQIGHGGIFTALSKEEAMLDLKRSIEICGNSNAFAYPFGDYSENCVEYVKEAGFSCAVTTEPGKVFPGKNPLLLPRVRMSCGQSIKAFESLI